MLLVVLGAGAVGGLVNAVMMDAGFAFPSKQTTQDGKKTIWAPGFLGNIFIDSVAAGSG